MATSELFFVYSASIDDQQIIITMVRSWLIKILLWFSHTRRNRVKQEEQQQRNSTPFSVVKNDVKDETSFSYIFSPPLKACMLRKIRCRIRPQTPHNVIIQLPQTLEPLKPQSMASFLNESQNCAEQLYFKDMPTNTYCKRYDSLIAINIDSIDSPQEQSTHFRSLTKNVKSKKKINFYRQSLIELVNSNSSLANYSHHYDNKDQAHSRFSSSISPLCVRKQKSDSLIFVHQRRRYSISKKRTPVNYSPHNINSITYDSPFSSDTTLTTPSSNSDVFSKNDKTWRLKIHDDLNKDGSRHFVMHKGSEESIRKRRQSKRAKRSEEKKQRIEEKISRANQRWQKYSNINYELVFFISRYYDQLPLCSTCRNYFMTHQTQFLSENPRASVDYAADAAIRSSSNKTITMKEAAKARLIQDYDKQTDIIFNLCDTCLNKCEQIRNELKQINFTQKVSNSPNINMLNMTTPELQPPSPSSPMFDIENQPFPSSPLNVNLVNQQKPSSPSDQITMIDLNQLYMNNIIQYHQIKLQQLYQQSQHIIMTQEYQQNCPSAINQQQLHHDLQSCLSQMQYHCLELLHLQYPGYSLSYPYIPSYNPQYLSYRQQETDEHDASSESSSSDSEKDTEKRRNMNTEDEDDENQQSIDDRLTIETCHGLVEYCNAPLDDFIRGLQVLKCLSTFNRYSS